MKGDFLRLVEEANKVLPVQRDISYESEFDDSLVNEEGEDAVTPELELDGTSVAPYFKGWLVSKLADDNEYGKDFNEVVADFRNDFTEIYGDRVSIDDATVTLETITAFVNEVKKTEEPKEEPTSTEDEVITEPVESDDMGDMSDTQNDEEEV